VDHTDIDNPLYEEFSKAEAIAKKYKLRYWGRIEKTKTLGKNEPEKEAERRLKLKK